MVKKTMKYLSKGIVPVASIIACSFFGVMLEGHFRAAIAQPSQNATSLISQNSPDLVRTIIVNETSNVIPYQLGNGGTAILFPGDAITLSGKNPGSIQYSMSVDKVRDVRLFLQPGTRYRFHMFGDTLNLSSLR
jgi:hypothetical protein